MVEFDLTTMLRLLWRARGARDERLVALGRAVLAELGSASGRERVRSLLGQLTGSGGAAQSSRSGAAAPPLPPRLHGVPGSRGRASGIVRLVRSAGDLGRVGAGDIIVCTTAEPGWQHAFDRAGGLVVESGGVSAAAMRAARERGIPAVRLPGATSLLHEGVRVTVQGDMGDVDLDGAHNGGSRSPGRPNR